MKFQKNSVSKLALTDLLRRKRTNLVKYLTDNGIYSYELLSTRCLSIGVIAPTEDQFLKARGTGSVCDVCSPSEGIVVLHPETEHHCSSSEGLNKPENTQIFHVTSCHSEEAVIDQEATKPKRKKKIFVNDDV